MTEWRYFCMALFRHFHNPAAGDSHCIPADLHLAVSSKRMNRIFLEIEGGMVGLGLLIYLLLGPTVISAWIAGTLLPVICTIAFLACCELRDGRLAFLSWLPPDWIPRSVTP